VVGGPSGSWQGHCDPPRPLTQLLSAVIDAFMKFQLQCAYGLLLGI
jgi:hypothetical protein